MEFMHYLSGAALASELIAKPEGAHTNSVSTHLVATTTMVVVPYVYESTRGLNGYSRLHMASLGGGCEMLHDSTNFDQNYTSLEGRPNRDILKTNKGKTVVVPFKAKPVAPREAPLFDKSLVPKLETENEHIVFRLNWGTSKLTTA
ncbi:hypothetical protein M9H77_12305 [Catharanthus roseus]|uniref:Uncharacterized protein n=1 Tax=Catharanthus roseus TaxID=4058 RepID=A0ACC0BGZ8_CATRO|nr:hypothetical protein M9H77_12305 [Catharanthus roseus]